jgi:hypothetical protein
LAILGAGPIGLQAALQAVREGYQVTVYDKGELADHIRQWGHVKLFSPFGLNTTEMGIEAILRDHKDHTLPQPNEFVTGTQFRDSYLIPLSMTSALDPILKMKTEVLAIARTGLFHSTAAEDPRRANAPFRLHIRDDKKTESFVEFDLVFDCTGTYSQHRWAGHGGISALNERSSENQIAYGLEDILGTRRAYYAGKSIIVIGGGYSAATTVCNLATLAEEHSATWVFWLSQAAKGSPIPRIANDTFRERDRLAAKANSLAARGEGNLEYHPQTWIEEITCHGPDKGFRVVGKCAGQEQVWEVDRVIANVGYRPNTSLFSELHVQIPSSDFRQPEPNFFVLGCKSASSDRTFLLQQGYEQLEEVFAFLSGRSSSPMAA